jgi:pantetheine-phosphate adenylyltransferase
MVEFAEKVGAKAVVRGLRIGADFEYEREMALMNNKLSPDIEIVCLMASLKYQYLSSSRLKEVAGFGGDIFDLVPEPVANVMKKKYLNHLGGNKPK